VKTVETDAAIAVDRVPRAVMVREAQEARVAIARLAKIVDQEVLVRRAVVDRARMVAVVVADHLAVRAAISIAVNDANPAARRPRRCRR
jgi:hypothetical protein